MKEPTLREVIDGMDVNIRSALQNIESLRYDRRWLEPGLTEQGKRDERYVSVKVPPRRDGQSRPRDEEAELFRKLMDAETERLITRFGCEVLHWRKEKAYWRGILDADPAAGDRALPVSHSPMPKGLRVVEDAEPGSDG